MFENDLRKALEHFDYDRAKKVLEKICKKEINSRYQVTDEEDTLYWELDTKIVAYEKHNTGDKTKVKGSGIWVDVWAEVY